MGSLITMQECRAMIISRPGLLPSAIFGPQAVLMSMVAVTNNSQEDRAAQNWPQHPLAATLERTGLPLICCSTPESK